MTVFPPALDRFGAELELAIRRDLGSGRRRRRLLRGAALPAVIAAVALGILAVLPGGGSSVVGRAAAALEASDDTILHLQLRGEQHNPDGSVVFWQSESWQLGEAPYTRRQIEVGPEGIRAETLVRGERAELYDAQANTIYVASQEELSASQPRPKINVVSAARLRELVHSPRVDTALKVNKNGYAVIATKEGAKRLREKWARAGQESAVAGEPVKEPFRAEILALLDSGHARETGRVEVRGRNAIRIESPDGRQVYLVDPVTYAPIEWTSAGDGGSVTLRFPVYEELSVDANSMELFDLEAQYPEAHVERGPAAYRAAEARLFPNG
jgi:hypothetical protein